MAQGTSAHGEDLSEDWTDTGQEQAGDLWRRRTIGLDWRVDWSRAAIDPALLQPLAISVVAGLLLGLTITAAGRPLADKATDGASGSLSALLLAMLVAACALAALAIRRPGGRVAAPLSGDDRAAAKEPSQLLAQMHHELRTPLNAMIGFSQVMLHELHGPLGNVRYQEYAAHISESGGRLLRASEDALAVAATMSALVADMVADGRTLRRERLPARVLLEEAWGALAAPTRDIRFDLEDSRTADFDCHITCDRQATSQALQHLLGEAVSHTPPGGTIAARSRCVMGAGHIEIAVTTPALQGDHGNICQPMLPSGADGLRVMLARSLLEMQDATLGVGRECPTNAWSVHIEFPQRASAHVRRPGEIPSAQIPRFASPARRGGFAAAAAARASVGSHAAPLA